MANRKPKATRYAPGLENFDQIIRAAEKVLVEHGHAALTMRRVAEECGIGLGNLSYYFPTKQSLVKALLDHLMLAFQNDIGRIMTRKDADPKAVLAEVTFSWMQSNQSRYNSRLWVELWAMANNDRDIRKELDKSYQRGLMRAKKLFSSLNDKLSEEELDALALLAISMRDGVMVFANDDRPGARLMPLLASYTVEALLELALKPKRAMTRGLVAQWLEDNSSAPVDSGDAAVGHNLK